MRSSVVHAVSLAAALAVALGLAACGGGGILDVDDEYPHPSDYPIHGIDVSKYQGDIDWSAVTGSGVKFAWIKATEGGDYADEKFAANWAAAKAAGVPRGAYHFVYWCRSPAEEIAWFEQHVPVEDDALPPVLDVEVDAELAHLPSPSGASADHRRHEDDAGRNGTPLRPPPDHLHHRRFLRGDPVRRRLHRLSDLGALDQAPPGRQIRAAATGASGNTRPMVQRPAFRAMSTRTPITASPHNGRRSSMGRSSTRRGPPLHRARRFRTPVARSSTPRSRGRAHWRR